jgi:ABC-2 type transport system permease protein
LSVAEAATQVRLFFRNPVQALFLVALPLTLVPLLEALNPDTFVRLPGTSSADAGFGVGTGSSGGLWPYAQYSVPVLAAFGIASACFATLAIRLTVAREQGALKRVRSTPLPPSAHVAGRVGAALLVGLLVGSATVALGVLGYDVELVTRLLPAAVISALVGAATFCCLGVAITRVLTSADAAPGIVLAIVFPVAFVSNVFFVPSLAPDWMRTLGSWLPLAPFARALAAAFNPDVTSPGLQVADLARVAAWGVVGALLSVRHFLWVPHREVARARGVTRRRRGRWWPVVVALAIGAAAVIAVIGNTGDRGDTTVDLGGVNEFPADGAAVVDAPLPSGADDPDPSDPLSSVVQPDDDTIPLAVVRDGDATAAFVARQPTGGCDVVPTADVAPAWVTEVQGTAAGVPALVDPCGGALYDATGESLAGAPAGLLPVPVQVDGDMLVADLGAVGAPAPSAGTFESPVPVAATYTAAAIAGAPVPGRAIVTWTIDTVTVLADPGAPLVSIATTGIAAGAYFGVTVGSESLPELSTMEPVRWRSLVVGGTAEAPGTDGGTVRATRLDATRWEFRGGESTLAITIDGGAAPWARLTIDLRSASSPVTLDLQQIPA